MSYVDLRIHFKDEDADGYTDRTANSVERLNTNIPKDELEKIVVAACQSDRWLINVTQAMTEAISDGYVKVKEDL